MSTPPASPAAAHEGGTALCALLLRASDRVVLATTPLLAHLLGGAPSPGTPLAPPWCDDWPPAGPPPPRVTLRGPAAQLPCLVTALGDTLLLSAEHQFAPVLLDALPLDLAVLDAGGHYLYVNPAAIRDEQVRRGITGRTDREYVQWRQHPAERAERRAAAFEQARLSGAATHFTEQFVVQGADLTLQRTYWPLLNPDGSLRLMLGYGEDQTRDRTLAEQMALLRIMVDTSVDPLLVLDARPGPGQMRVVYSNPATRALLREHGLEELPDTPMTQWPMAQGNGVNVLAVLAQLPDLPPGRPYHDLLFLPDAQQWLELRINAILDPEGRRSHWAVSLRDMTTQRQVELQQQRVGRVHQLALAGAPLDESLTLLLDGADHWNVGWQVGALIASDPPRAVGQLPPGFARAVSQLPPGLLGAHWRRLDPACGGGAQVYPDLHSHAPAPLHALLRGEARSLIELPLYGRDGQLLGALIATHPTPHAWTASVVETLRTLATSGAILAEQHLSQEHLRHLAYHDPLTGLLNRAALTARADAALRQPGARLAFGLMDLNRFRFLNDAFGHPVGDELLRELAARLRQLARRHHLTALARMGGDEFGLLARPEQIEAVVSDLREVFEQPFEIHGNALLLEASLGWSVAPERARDGATLLQQADAALYSAKLSQQFSRTYRPTPPAQIPAVTLESALRASLRDGHFRLVYQPQIDLRSRELIGAEALLRWTHPQLGAVTPDQFIPVAELAGLMPRLGEWVLRAACAEAAGWSNPNLSVSVNVSSRQLGDPTFNERVREALRRSGLSPARLVLEVTESGLIDNPARAHDALQELRSLGVRVSMDDFGTGYASLFSLRSLPVDELKIDRAFVRDLGQDSRDARESQAVVSASVLMARALHIELLAEGVETPQQEQALRDAGCDLGQGWLYAPALERADFDAFEQAWPARLRAPRHPGAGDPPEDRPARTPPRSDPRSE
ncbi:hypothetical protein GCM10008956_12660 [Deinococcus arenae]|uniref:Uncharacterized protein n=1 Tax=Deinococcus arenae TaxID=1452751 RepID=A0A8H9GQG8_9DEIO|nr:EAL domain-containing protein [Deinococcus arenae]AWT37666.1 hypothetical protein DM785_18410 [Deinococcus actinosclerus]GGM37776.1 hypothetical protein GCM10008956_12660 [Deinococcus arenae]